METHMTTLSAVAQTAPSGRSIGSASHLVTTAGLILLRTALVCTIAYFGAFKFTSAEAHAIEPLVRNSPLLSWLYRFTDVGGASRLIGGAELMIAALILLRPYRPVLSAIGSLAAIGMFATTLSFLFTTPGAWQRVDGFLVPSGAGAFIIKDVFLLGAALWSTGDALGGVGRARMPARQRRAATSDSES
jgi:reactive chlorine resistance protein C